MTLANLLEARSEPVTPELESVAGSSTRLQVSCNGAFFIDQHCIEQVTSSHPSDEVLHSILLHESLPYCKVSSDIYAEGCVTVKCRRRTCKWMYNICDYFQLNRKCVAIASFYVDRYFTLTDFSDGPAARQFQLIAVTSLFIAIKTHGEMKDKVREEVIEFNIDFCASTSRGLFSAKEIEECERTMLHTLEWHVNPVVPSNVIDTLVNYLPQSLRATETLYIYDLSKHLVELSTLIPTLDMIHKPSVIAFASIIYVLTFGENLSSHIIKFESALQEASCYHYFNEEKRNVAEAVASLQAMCPNLNELLHCEVQTLEHEAPDVIE